MANMTFGVNLIPDANNTRSLGNSDKKWHIYADTINDVDVNDLGGGESTALSLTLASGSWSSATPPTQTITATGVTASNNIIVGVSSDITSEQYDAAAAAKLVCTAQGTNSITITAYGTEPTVNIPISVVILG